MTDSGDDLHVELLVVVAQYLDSPGALLRLEERVCVRSSDI